MAGENILSDRQVKAALPKPKAYRLRDGGSLYGRVIAVKGEASISWQYFFKWQGRTECMSLGHYPEVSLKDAREKRNAARALLASDPPMHPVVETRRRREESKAQEQAATLEKTVRGLFDDWQTVHLQNARKDHGESTRQFFERNVFRFIGEIKAREVRRGHVTQLIDQVLARGARRTANLLLSGLKQMFSHGVVRGIVDLNPTADFKKQHAGGKESPRTRVLTTEEIADLGAKLPKAGISETMQAAIRLLLATGVRVGELSLAEWSEFDLDAALWTIPAERTKAKREHLVHLSSFALAQIKILKSYRENKYLLAGAKKNTSIGDKSIAKITRDYQRDKPSAGRYIKTVGALRLTGGDWSPHDLRRTMATRMGDLGVLPHVVEKCLAHRMDGVMAVYNHQEYLPERKAAFDAWGALLAGLFSGKANVVPIKRRRAR